MPQKIVFGAEDVDRAPIRFGAEEISAPTAAVDDPTRSRTLWERLTGTTTEVPPDIAAQNQAMRARMTGQLPPERGDLVLENVQGLASYGPAIGGTIGGIYGGVPGAAAGGAIGEGVNLLLNPAQRSDTAPGMAGQVVGHGALQAAGQGVGSAALGVAAKASPWLMNRALNLTAKLSREFPNMSTTMIEHALTVSKGGLENARALLTVAKGKATAALMKAQAAGATVPVTAATDGLQKTLVEVLNSADVEGGLAILAAVERRIGGGRAGILTPVAADALKRSLQTQSKQLYTAAKMGQGKPNVSIQARALADMAESLNDAIGTITTNAGAEGYRAANASAAELIGAMRGITTGIRPGANLYQAMVRPGVGAVIGGLTGAETGGTKGAVVGTVVGTALTSPEGMSRLAVALTKPSVQALLRQSPRLAAAIASMQATAGQEP